MPTETGMQRFLRSKAAPYVGLAVILLLGLLFAFTGLYAVCFGGVMMGVLLYIVPKTMGADIKKMAVFGVVFFIVLTIVSAVMISKPILEYEGDWNSGDFRNISVAQISDDTFEISVTYDGSGTMEMNYSKIISVWAIRFYSGNATSVVETSVSENVHRFIMIADSSSAYSLKFAVDNNNDGKNDVLSDDVIGPVTMDGGELTMFSLKWNAYHFLVQVMVIFILILLLTTWMRKSLERTRERMEKEGRLYPQGYGRCKNCNTVILPGEVVCRKCGEYIDIPDDMKVKKTEYFECSDCGKEVPVDADKCPFCGAGFDDEAETEQTFTCSECKGNVPADADICPHCGERFDD